jgi:hypothetical protein
MANALACVFFALLGFMGGGISVFFAFESRRKSVDEQRRRLGEKDARLKADRTEFESQAARWAADANANLQAAQTQFKDACAKWTGDHESRWKAAWAELQSETARVTAARTEIDARIISYQELRDENSILKCDLHNLDVNLRKLRLDSELHRQAQETLSQKVKELGSRYLKENVKWIGASLNPNNFVTCKQRLQDVIERCRGIDFDVPANEEATLLANLRSDYELVVRQAFEREEQARIKAQIREEQMREREIERELKQLEREREAIKAALEKALREATDQHSEEVERLRARLTEAEERSKRAISQAQLTKSGFVYVLSNIGSFGEGVFKVGMSRRLEPMDRVRELGGASVPFPFVYI